MARVHAGIFSLPIAGAKPPSAFPSPLLTNRFHGRFITRCTLQAASGGQKIGLPIHSINAKDGLGRAEHIGSVGTGIGITPPLTISRLIFRNG
jgi:hypothetical protein